MNVCGAPFRQPRQTHPRFRSFDAFSSILFIILFSRQRVSWEVPVSVVFWGFLGGAEVSWSPGAPPTLAEELGQWCWLWGVKERRVGHWTEQDEARCPLTCCLPKDLGTWPRAPTPPCVCCCWDSTRCVFLSLLCSIPWLQGCWASCFILITASIFVWDGGGGGSPLPPGLCVGPMYASPLP